MNPATSQDGHDTDGNSIPGGEPVHCPAFVLSTIDVISFPAGFTLLPDAMQVDVPLAPPGTKQVDSHVN